MTYEVVVHFNKNATETMQDKLKHIMLREMERENIKKVIKMIRKVLDKVVTGYLNLSFIQKMNQMGIKCIIHYSSIPEIFDLEINHPDHLKRVKKKVKITKEQTHDTARNVECIQENQSLNRR